MAATAITKLTAYDSEANLGHTTVFKALTDINFTPDSGCETAYGIFVKPSLVGWDPGYNFYTPENATTRCHPPVVTQWWNQDSRGAAEKLRTVISIGPIVCPSPYTTVTTMVNTQSRTMVACCPSGYNFVSVEPRGMAAQCTKQLQVGEVYKYIVSTSTEKDWITTTSTVDTKSTAYAVQINGWLFPTFAASMTEITTGPSASTPTNETLPSDSSSGGLSQDAKVGIASSMSFLLVVGLIGVIFFIKRRRLATRTAKAQREHSSSSRGDRTELDTGLYEARGSQVGHQYLGRQYGDGRANLHEMPHSGPPRELYAPPIPMRESHGRSDSPIVSWTKPLVK